MNTIVYNNGCIQWKEDPMKSKTQAMRRKAKTPRGVDVMDRVVKAAKKLLGENWLDQISITELAREAGIVRASLLLQFPNGWPDIANTILIRELDNDYLCWLIDIGEKHKKRPGSLNRFKTTPKNRTIDRRHYQRYFD